MLPNDAFLIARCESVAFQRLDSGKSSMRLGKRGSELVRAEADAKNASKPELRTYIKNFRHYAVV